MNQLKEQLLLTGALLLGLGIMIGQFFLLILAPNHKFFNVYLSLFVAEVFFFIWVCFILYRKKFHKTKAKRLSEKLKKYKQGKSELISIASHQLRTPLSILSGYIELLHDDVYGETSQKMKKVFKNMEIANERLLRVIEHFLCASEVSFSSISYRFEKQNVSKVIKKILRELDYKVKENNVTVSKKIQENIFADIDKQKLHHAIYNVVDNALKYSINKSINIHVKKTKKDVIISCRDTGIGFLKKDKKNIATKFYRSEVAKNNGTKGTGLGLFVCKTFILVHNGKFSISSPGINKGAIVKIVIPINQPKTFAKG